MQHNCQKTEMAYMYLIICTLGAFLKDFIFCNKLYFKRNFAQKCELK